MRTAAICPTCANYYNAACIIYDGIYLNNLGVAPLDPLDVILGKINTSLQPRTGSGVPHSVPLYVGQYYLDLTGNLLYIGLSNTVPNWGLVGTIITTTTTTSTTTTP